MSNPKRHADKKAEIAIAVLGMVGCAKQVQPPKQDNPLWIFAVFFGFLCGNLFQIWLRREKP
jgi:hypothetical protein